MSLLKLSASGEIKMFPFYKLMHVDILGREEDIEMRTSRFVFFLFSFLLSSRIPVGASVGV